jgi:hypothetical protein
MRLKMFVITILFGALPASMILAQTPISGSMTVSAGFSGLPPLGHNTGMVTMRVEDMDVEPAKGAPFCATVTTEHTQAFADGNRIHTSDNSSLCRDSQGRTRREASLNLLGAAAQTSTPKLITIVDPVAGFRYMLDSESKTAHRIPIGSGPNVSAMKMAPGERSDKGGGVMMYQRVGIAGPNIAVNDNMIFRKSGEISDEPPPATENLGDQTIDGIHATGTRITTTIPAGKMGNEQPILVTSERWYSPELKATVMTKHSDPWAGELKTQFTNVNTSEPDTSLFSVPADYKIVTEKAERFMFQKRLPPAAPSR